MSVIDCSKCIHCEVCGNRYANDGCAGECSYFLEHNPSGDCISREAVRSKIWKERVEKDEGCNSEYIRGLKTAIGFIGSAQAVPLPNEQIAWEQGYEAGLAQGKHDRPQGEWISVKDKLPDKEGRCLVFTDYGDVTMDSFRDGMFVCNLGNVTHWKPLPKAPESEAKNE